MRGPESNDRVAVVTWSVGAVGYAVDHRDVTFGTSRHIFGKLLTAEKDHLRTETAVPANPRLDCGRIDVHHVLGRREAHRFAERGRLPCRMEAKHGPGRRTNLLTRYHADCQSAC